MRRANSHFLLCATLAGGTTLLFFYPVLFTGQVFFFRDIHRWFYPMKYFLGTTLAGGELPYWSSQYFCGAPFLSDLQSGVFYPPSILMAALPFPEALSVYVALHFFLAFIFCFLFARATGAHVAPALFAAIGFCWGGYLLSSVNTLNNLTTAVWLPAVLLAVDRAVTGTRPTGFLWVVAAFSLCLLGGEPQLFLMIAVTAAGYGLLRSWGQAAGNRMAVIRHAGWIAASAVAALAVCMVQMGPMFIDYINSARQGGIPFEEATRFSLDWDGLRRLVVPIRFNADFVNRPDALSAYYPGSGRLPWLLTAYPGMLCIPLAVYGALRRFTGSTLFWLTAFFVSIVLALGNHTPVYRLFYMAAPFFRFPEKFMLIATFSLVMLAVAGADCLQQRCASASRLRRWLILLPILLFIDLLWAHVHLNPVVPKEFYQYHHSAYAPILSDPGRFRVYVDSQMPPLKEPTSIMDHHARWQMLLLPNLGVLHGLDHVGGKSGLELRYQYFITELLNRPWPEKAAFLKLANVKYIVSAYALDSVAELKDQIVRVSPNVFRLVGHMPRGWMAGQAVPTEGAGPELIGRQAIDFRTSYFLGTWPAEAAGSRYHAVVDRLDYVRNGEIHATVTPEQQAVLVLSEAAYPGWRVFVDGEEQPLLQPNFFFQGVALAPGPHDVVFLYRPPYFYVFSTISGIAVLLWAVLLVGSAWKQRRPIGT
jgi:hypothetical protein